MDYAKHQVQRFKIVIVGDGGVGKTTFINRHLIGDFSPKYVPTMGVDVHPLLFHTNYGTIVFDCWDIAGQERFGGSSDEYYASSKGLILMFDVTSKLSYGHLGEWYDSVLDDIPLVVCGNKVDMEGRVVKHKDITFHVTHKCQYYDISAKSSYNYEKPFLWLAREIMGKKDLEFVAQEIPFE